MKFNRIERLPPYILSVVTEWRAEARSRGEDIIDFGMGNPDQSTPQHIVEKMVEAARKSHNHRYSASRGIKKLRMAVTNWYKRNYDVELDYDTEAIVTIGSKEGLSHLALSITGPGDTVLVPTPTYAIHPYAFIIAGADVVSVPVTKDTDFFDSLLTTFKNHMPKPKVIVINFPHNPTTVCVEKDFFEKIVEFAKEHDLIVIHDFAYADIVFDDYKAPSFLQVPGAKDVGVEFFSLSKSYNMPGWRVGFCVGNPDIIAALGKLKGYLDYGMFQPIQIASIIALNGPDDCVNDIKNMYKSRRDVLIDGLERVGWSIEKPKATMFVWAELPEKYRNEGSMKFAKLLLEKGKVAVSPGIGFGEDGDNFVRFALVENEHRIKQAVRGIKSIL